MSSSLPNRTVADTDHWIELSCPATVRLRITVANAAVFAQIGRGAIPQYAEQEEFLVPGVYSLERRCDAIKVRAAVGGLAKPAQVSIVASTADEVSS